MRAVGGANPEGKRFCGDCGAVLATPCPACGAAAEPGRRFCGDCGRPLPPAAVPGAAPALAPPVAERRVCSVVFADLVGFTTLSESRDPEEVRELLSRYFATARTVVQRYGGVVEKFIGDAVMAVWGTPVATEGDTERAVRAALDLVAAVAALGAELGAPGLAARAGVVTGEVAVTLGATGEGMVAGDAVNTAARVQATAVPGAVLVDSATRRLASAGIGFDDAGRQQLKGKVVAEHLWRAVRVVSGVGGAQRVDGLEAPLTGREVELRLVKDLFHVSAERRTPRLLVVSGPAGVGKSRMGWEFEKYVDGLAEDVFWHRGRCLSYGEGVAFWALAEIVRQRLGIAEEDALDVAARKLAEGLDRFVTAAAERTYIGVRLARLLGVPAAGDSGAPFAREELFAGWRLFLERLAEREPVVLLIEDAQYADAGLLDFLDHLVDWARDAPLFVLVFTRPEMERARPGFGSGRNRTALALDPLDAGSMGSLLEALVPGMPPAAMAAIASHAQGIPLFAVETVRSLIDRDVVVPHGGVYRLVADVGELAVPDSLHALLAARLDSLDPATRSLVADAAVLGSSFPPEALVAVSGAPADHVRAALQDLVRREVLEVSADRLSPQLGTYRFAQGMLRQVAYETLSRRDRKARHLAVARHLRTAFANDGDEVVDVVARHYLDALGAVPDDADSEELREQAIAALERAGQRGERTGAPRSAADSYTAAAQLSEERGDESGDLAAAGLWERAALAEQLAAVWEPAVGDAERAEDLYRRHGRSRDAARARGAAGLGLSLCGRYTEARARLAAALEVLGEQPDADTVTALAALGRLEALAGTPQSDRLTTEALALGQALDVDGASLAQLFSARGIVHGFANRPAQAAAYFREAAHIAQEASATRQWALALINLADVTAGSDPAAAAVAARSAMLHARRVGDRQTLGTAVANLVIALLTQGQWDEAAAIFDEVEDADGLGDQEFVQEYAALLAALRGDIERAAAALALAPQPSVSEDPQDRAMTAVVHALLAVAREQPEAALSHALAALGDAELLGIRSESTRWAWPVAARAAHVLQDAGATAELLALLDAHPAGHLPPLLRSERDLARARVRVAVAPADGDVRLTEAVEGVRRVASPYHLAHALLDQAEHRSLVGDAAGAVPLVAEARSIAEVLGARPLLARATLLASSCVTGLHA